MDKKRQRGGSDDDQLPQHRYSLDILPLARQQSTIETQDPSTEVSWDSVSKQPHCVLCDTVFEDTEALAAHTNFSDHHFANMQRFKERKLLVASNEETPSAQEQQQEQEQSGPRLLYSGFKTFVWTGDRIAVKIVGDDATHLTVLVSPASGEGGSTSSSGRMQTLETTIAAVLSKLTHENTRGGLLMGELKGNPDDMQRVMAQRNSIITYLLSHLERVETRDGDVLFFIDSLQHTPTDVTGQHLADWTLTSAEKENTAPPEYRNSLSRALSSVLSFVRSSSSSTPSPPTSPSSSSSSSSSADSLTSCSSSASTSSSTLSSSSSYFTSELRSDCKDTHLAVPTPTIRSDPAATRHTFEKHPKLVTAKEAVSMIADRATVTIGGFVGSMHPEALVLA
jgi:hypothetical protein